MTPTIQSIDTSGLNRAVAIAQEYSSRTPPIMAATAGFFIARQATRDCHRATVSGIDAKLGVTSAIKLKKNGQPTKKRAYKTIFPRLNNGILTGPDLITISRMWPQSEYNQLTNYRWFMDKREFAGGGRANFFAFVREHAKKMVSARHKSIAFVASTGRAVVKALEPLVPSQYRRNAVADDPEAKAAGMPDGAPMGTATVNSTGQSATMKGDLLAGVGGVPPNLNEQHNEAMFKWMTGPLQNAVNTEAEKQTAYAVAHQEMDLRAGKFASAGVRVT